MSDDIITRLRSHGRLDSHEAADRIAELEARALSIAENALAEVERATPLMPLGAPGSVMRRAQELGQRLQAAEARAAALESCVLKGIETTKEMRGLDISRVVEAQAAFIDEARAILASGPGDAARPLPCVHPEGCDFCAWCGFHDAAAAELAGLRVESAELDGVRALLEELGCPAQDEAYREIPDAERIRRLLARKSGGK